MRFLPTRRSAPRFSSKAWSLTENNAKAAAHLLLVDSLAARPFKPTRRRRLFALRFRVFRGPKKKRRERAQFASNHPWQRAGLKAITLMALLILLGGAFSLAILLRYGRDLPDYYFLKHYQPSVITHLYDRLGAPVYELAEERRIYTHLSDIPSRLIRAFLSAEDKNFYAHGGVDLPGLAKAVFLNTVQKKWSSQPMGGSTITQQVAKILLVGNQRSFERKIREAILAMRLEKTLTKDKLLELYLNQIYLGLGVYGVASAALAYFQKTLQELSLAECAFLASLPKAPGSKTTLRTYKKLLDRRNWVLEQMRKNGVITRSEAQQAQNEPLPLVHPAPHEQTCTYFIEEARKELIRDYGEKVTYSAGIEATLTLHPHIQKWADEALQEALENYDRRKGWRGPWGHTKAQDDISEALKKAEAVDLPCRPAVVVSVKNDVHICLADGSERTLVEDDFLTSSVRNKLKQGDFIYVQQKEGAWHLAQLPQVTGGLAVVDAVTGEVLALSGGYAYSQNQFNGATQAYRQPGSAFKPFVYLTALNKGFHENSVLEERPVAIPTGGGSFYRPHNYNKTVYGGPMTLTDALLKSRNVFAVILAQKVGLRKILSLASKCGVADYFPLNYPVVLGAAETTVLRMASAYSVFFNGGLRVKPKLFLNITSPFTTCSRVSEAKEDLGLKKESLLQMKRMLAQCILRGTGKNLRPLAEKYPVHLYGKTGTSNDFKDAWFVGCIEPKDQSAVEFTHLKKGHPLVVAVFVGYPTPKSLGQHETGTKVALPAAYTFMSRLCEQSRPTSKGVEGERTAGEVGKDRAVEESEEGV